MRRLPLGGTSMHLLRPPERTFKVRINLRRFTEHLAREDRAEVSEADARRLLVRSGFLPRGDGWVVSERDLGLVTPAEVTSIEPIPPGNHVGQLS